MTQSRQQGSDRGAQEVRRGQGADLASCCPSCGREVVREHVYCTACGTGLAREPAAEPVVGSPAGERKIVSALFCDVAAYTDLSDLLDPEETKEIMSRIFGEAARVVAKYGGHIERFVGDAVMATFGAVKAHEDDPVRAVRTALEIRALVEKMNAQIEPRIGRPLSVHAGVASGLVVTSGDQAVRGIGRAQGDTVNLASRLCDVAPPGEVLVGGPTVSLTDRFFEYERLAPVRLKGKSDPVVPWRVVGILDRPSALHGAWRSRSRFVGRERELGLLFEAIDRVRCGEGSIVHVTGEVGIGKSRLVEEVRLSSQTEGVLWWEGRCQAYTRTVPYYLLMNLLSNAWDVGDGDSPKEVERKIEEGAARWLGPESGAADHLKSLYGLAGGHGRDAPESWQSGLESILETGLAAIVKEGPAVVSLANLHWVDPSSLRLLRALLERRDWPVAFFLTYRSSGDLLPDLDSLEGAQTCYRIDLRELAPPQAQEMTRSLLDGARVPDEVLHFVQRRAEGNPFYLEEIVGSLIDSEALVREDDEWRLTTPLGCVEVPPTVSGVIAAGLDRLESGTRQVLRDASVIGRVFSADVLGRTTSVQGRLQDYLRDLERLGFLQPSPAGSQPEHAFRHALTHQVAYEGILLKDRKEMHKVTAQAIESVYSGRLPEHYEALAHHYELAHEPRKAIDYLAKSGEKALSRHAVEEADAHYARAVELARQLPAERDDEGAPLLTLVIMWAPVFYFRGDFDGLVALMTSDGVRSARSDDAEQSAMVEVWTGIAYYHRAELREAYDHLMGALDLGGAAGSELVIGYASSWLANVCVDLGRLEEAVSHGCRGRTIARSVEEDNLLHYSLGYAYWATGDIRRAREIGEELLAIGRARSSLRAHVTGFCVLGHACLMEGDTESAARWYRRAIRISADPYQSEFPRAFLAIAYVQGGRFERAEGLAREVLAFSERRGARIIGLVAQGLLGIVQAVKGQLGGGLRLMEEAEATALEEGFVWAHANAEYLLGRFYLGVAEGREPVTMRLVLRNALFILRRAWRAAAHARTHLEAARAAALSIGARGMVAQADLALGRLHALKGRTEKAREHLVDAMRYFESEGATLYAAEAQEALNTLAMN